MYIKKTKKKKQRTCKEKSHCNRTLDGAKKHDTEGKKIQAGFTGLRNIWWQENQQQVMLM